jgi:hypothetical protein
MKRVNVASTMDEELMVDTDSSSTASSSFGIVNKEVIAFLKSPSFLLTTFFILFFSGMIVMLNVSFCHCGSKLTCKLYSWPMYHMVVETLSVAVTLIVFTIFLFSPQIRTFNPFFMVVAVGYLYVGKLIDVVLLSSSS